MQFSAKGLPCQTILTQTILTQPIPSILRERYAAYDRNQHL